MESPDTPLRVLSKPHLCATLLLTVLSGCQSTQATPPPAQVLPSLTADQRLERATESFRDAYLAYDPSSASYWGLPANNRSWADRSLSAIRKLEEASRDILSELRMIDAERLSSERLRLRRDMLIESLDAEVGATVCRFELWQRVNHLNGWHRDLAQAAASQPVGTGEERADALALWQNSAAFIDQEIANARVGLSTGYSAPRSVVERVIKQIETLVADGPDSALASPASRAADTEFKTEFLDLIDHSVRPKVRQYLRFLREDYLPQARAQRGITAHPNGADCYKASFRAYTLLDWTPEQILTRGQSLVASNTAEVTRRGSALFGTHRVSSIVAALEEAKPNRFNSEAELINFTKSFVERSRVGSQRLVPALPQQQLIVEPLPDFQRNSGVPSSYRPVEAADQPAVFRLASDRWQIETKGRAEVTAAHEGYPGHHLQIALAGSKSLDPVDRLGSNSAFSEGWGRYAEQLAEEQAFYSSPFAPITRRLWPGRGMVADAALHSSSWPEAAILAFIAQSGRYRGAEGQDLLDRIAVWPGQAASYDAGALEILSLREEASRQLGTCFALPAFHEELLKSGSIPLSLLRRRVNRWLHVEKENCTSARMLRTH